MTLSNRNALQHESSPYLLQHANNPVYWFAWNDEALKLAQAENKPILLSIGYSACHWCHVMAHESFEDEATAMIMNQYFVNIKVDREERPDLDRVYQLAHQLLTQRSGGWPLTVFLTPDDRIPFFAGTYFPKQARYNLPSFQQLLHKVAQFYSEHLDELRKQNESLLEAIRSLRPAEPLDPALELSAAPLDIGRRQLQENMDWEHGGFGKAPKFPHATSLSMLIQHWWGTRTHSPTADVKALEMAQFTLAKMANGGINDQVGGGFCRYSVDDYWMIPHFEKMLYDNGSLLHVYVEAWLATRNPLFQQVAESIGQWVIRDMQSTSGGYFSSIDADSEGKEGAFYVWSKDEVRAVLPETDYPLYARRFGLNFPANFEDKWYPHVFTDWESLANEFQLDRTELQSRVGHCNQLLHKQREKRIHPNRDEKILCAWNALMIKAMAFAGQFLQAPEFIASAEKALTFIHEHHWHKGRLLATSKNGKAQLMAYLDDYIFLADALLSLLQVRWRDQDLGFLITVVETVLDRFEDKESGGFYFTAHDHEPLIDRPKPFGDESLASGNGVAVSVLIKMGYLLSDEKYLVAAERCLKAAWPSINQLPYAHNTLLQGLRLYLDPPEIIVLRGEQDAISRWRHRCLQAYSPSRLVFAIPNDSQNLPAALHSKHVSDTTVAYRCLGSHCSAPIKDIEALSRLLQRKRS